MRVAKIEVPEDEQYHPAASMFQAIANVTPTPPTISKVCSSGELPAKKILGKWMCRKKDFVAYMDAQSQSKSAGQPIDGALPAKQPESKGEREHAAAMASLADDGIE